MGPSSDRRGMRQDRGPAGVVAGSDRGGQTLEDTRGPLWTGVDGLGHRAPATWDVLRRTLVRLMGLELEYTTLSRRSGCWSRSRCAQTQSTAIGERPDFAGLVQEPG